MADAVAWTFTGAPPELAVEADFDAGDVPGAERLSEVLLGDASASDVVLHAAEPQPDWIAVSARGLEPFDVGRRLRVDPSPEGIGEPGERVLLRIAPERAFGTGTHESTRLLLEELDRDPPEGLSVLDVGSGSGILALAASGLGAERVVALEMDDEAVFCGRRNGVRPAGSPIRWIAGSLDCLAETAYDVVLANILPEVLIPEMRRLAARTAPGGRLLLAGILAAAGDDVAEAMHAAGLSEERRPARGGWVALVGRRP